MKVTTQVSKITNIWDEHSYNYFAATSIASWSATSVATHTHPFSCFGCVSRNASLH